MRQGVMKMMIALFGGFLLLSSGACAQKEEESIVKAPANAGAFYPASPALLKKMVNSFLDKVPRKEIEGKLIALIVPHAGYIYSGEVAAFAYKQLEKEKFETVILVGPSHYHYFKGISVFNKGLYRTPLGDIPIDSSLAKKIIEGDKAISFVEEVHQREHSLEVQLPFLQTASSGFKIVPILMGDQSLSLCHILSRVLAKEIKGKNILLIASSDLSHYHSYEEANKIDAQTVRLIEGLEPLKLHEKMSQKEVELCGGGPVVTALLTAKELGADRVEILKYANSGDVTSSKEKVVGYLAAGAYRSFELNQKAQKELLEIARKTLTTYLKEGRLPEIKIKEPILNETRGAFVTLTKQGRLRGCIGQFSPEAALYKVVQEMAISAATKDSRFFSLPDYPITAEQLEEIEIEISVLSPLRKIDDIDEIKMGIHGIYIKKGFQSGCFLPQVAEETGWSKEEFLEHCARDKAGLSLDTWRKGAEIYIFTAQVFKE